MPRTFRSIACLCLCSVLLLMSGCSNTPTVVLENKATQRSRLIATPAPTLSNDPAILYKSVLTDKRIVSLVFEGYTDDLSMLAIMEELKKAKVSSIFFLSGVSASEHPDVVKAIHQAGFVIGNYGINAPKSMEEQDAQANVHQFRRSQELIEPITGNAPTLFRCNGSIYTKEVLQAASLVGLEAGVEPGVFLNHRSFHQMSDAQQFVQRLTRGSIITIKLGQELDFSEFNEAKPNMDDIAVDPPPFLSDDMQSTIINTYANIVPVVAWLIEALKADGYAMVSPEELQAYRIAMFDSPTQLDAKTLAALKPDAYALPATDFPMGLQEHAPKNTNAWSGTVLIGDALTTGVQDYVQWRRKEAPEYLDGLQFLTSANFGVVSSLMRISSTSDHPQLDGERLLVEDALAKMKARAVLLMPGLSDVRRYSQEKLIDSLKVLIYQIRTKIPGVRIFILTIPPGIAKRYGEPTNARIFQYNLAVARFCLEYDVPLIDTAYALRDDQGNLNEFLCIDPDTAGIHLNDAGNERWIDCLRRFMPF